MEISITEETFHHMCCEWERSVVEVTSFYSRSYRSPTVFQSYCCFHHFSKFGRAAFNKCGTCYILGQKYCRPSASKNLKEALMSAPYLPHFWAGRCYGPFPSVGVIFGDWIIGYSNKTTCSKTISPALSSARELVQEKGISCYFSRPRPFLMDLETYQDLSTKHPYTLHHQ